MIAPDIEIGIARLGDLVNAARVILPFTGAGISTECGIPDFRSPGGLWSRLQPIPFDRFMASAAVRDESWRRRFAMETEFSTARPGRGHRALASLHRMGKIPAVITQNIDNLHQVSGFAADKVVELHGNTTYATCLDCARRYELAWVRERYEAAGHAPDCAACAATSKPQRSRSVRPCRRRRCTAPSSTRRPATCSWRSVRRWWCGRRLDS